MTRIDPRLNVVLLSFKKKIILTIGRQFTMMNGYSISELIPVTFWSLFN